MSSEVVTQLEQEATKRMYERLIAARDKSKTADESVIRDLEGSRMFQDAFCCTDPIYKEQIDIIKSTLPDVVHDDTVGEHLYGCMQPELAVEIACTPACADRGLINPDLAPCELASYEKKGGVLKKINGVSSNEAHIFIASRLPQGNDELTNTDRNLLRSQGIKVITTYNQDGDTINYVLGESIDLTQPDPTPQPPPPEETTSANWGWGLLVIAIVVIIIMALVLGRR